MEKTAGLRPDVRQSKIDSIQVLRGLAALAVTIFHLKESMSAGDPFEKEISFLFNSGSAGVSLFFVISGFIMVYITRDTPSGWQRISVFLLKRVIRIWPAYAIITLFYCILQNRLSSNPIDVSALGSSLLFLPLSNVDPPFYGYALLPVGWSLNYEIYFYLLVAISMTLGRWRWHFFFVLTALTLIVLPLSMGACSLRPNEVSPLPAPYLGMITNPIIWNFVSGIVIGLLFIHPYWKLRLTRVFSSPWTVYLFVSLAVWQYFSGFFSGLGPFQWGVGAVAVFSAVLFHYHHRPVHFPSWLVWLGDVSFSIYLVHLPVKMALTYAFQKLGYPVFSHGTAMFFLSLALTLFLSRLSYEYLELRLSNYLKRITGLEKKRKPKRQPEPQEVI